MTPAPLTLSRPLARPDGAVPWHVRIGADRVNLALFALFTLYGPALHAAGELRYVEIVVLVLPLLSLRDAFRSARGVTGLLAALFLLTAAAQFVSDAVNHADPASTVKRVGSYLILAVLLVAVRWLCRDDANRLRWILLGYCLSYVTLMILGSTSSAGYAEQPWRLGFGFAVGLAACVIASWFRRGALYGTVALAVLAFVHLVEQARALALFSAAAAGLAAASALRGKPRPAPLALQNVALVLALGAALIFGALQGARFATDHQLFPDQLQIKMEEQLNSPVGLLAAARPDTFTAIYAIGKRPLIGFGSSSLDNEVWGYYTEISNASYIGTRSYQDYFNQTFNKEWDLGIPNHSHLFGAWADAGILAMLSWLATLGLAGYVLFRTWRWSTPYAPLFFFIGLNLVWDVLFSPGPHRMDIALRLEVMTFSVGLLRALDRGPVRRPALVPARTPHALFSPRAPENH